MRSQHHFLPAPPADLNRIENMESLKAWTLIFNPQEFNDSKEVEIKAMIDSDAGHIVFQMNSS